MATSLHFRPQNRDLGMVMRHVDEDLTIFLGSPNADDKEINDHPALGESYVNVGLDPKSGNLFSSASSQEEIVPVLADVKFLNVEVGRSDHNWLVVQPDTLADMDEQDLPATKANCVAISEKSKQLENENDEFITSSDGQDSSSTNTDNSSSLSSVSMAKRRTSSTGSRKPTPTTKSKPSRPTTPTTRSTLPSPPFRPTIARLKPHPPTISKPGPRSATPTCKPTALTTVTSKKLSNPKLLTVPDKKRPVSEPRGRRMNGPISCSSRNKMPWSSSDGCEDVNPVVMGARMVNRVVSMRKLAPPPKDNFIGKSYRASSGFGRSMSKKSLDMAIRHMDIRRTISN